MLFRYCSPREAEPVAGPARSRRAPPRDPVNTPREEAAPGGRRAGAGLTGGPSARAGRGPAARSSPVSLPEPAPPPPALAAGPACPASRGAPSSAPRPRGSLAQPPPPAHGPARPGPSPAPERAEDVSPASLCRSSSHSRAAEPERSAAQPRALAGSLGPAARSCPSGALRPLAGASAAAARGRSSAGRPRPQRR
ncbi:nematocyst expressed protein 3-like [Pseudorca crassidens]|uniref:nematocyst expressed protein 3-like n=1 Tax=Pseudorca crassidens TaxID=82174 RepID=UPI00352E4C51